MRRLISFLALVITLTACVPATPMATPTATIEIPPTSTATPTQIPATPTATRDPNMPEGATGKDQNGNWIKPLLDTNGKQVIAENGTPMVETWLSFPTNPNGETMSRWFVDHVKNPTFQGGIPSVDQPNKGFKTVMPIYIYVESGSSTPFIQHVPDMSVNDWTYSTNFMNVMLSRYINEKGNISANDFVNLFPDKFSISLTDAQGNPHTIYGDEKFTIVLVDPADIPNPDFQINNSSGPTTHILSMTIFDDATHSVTILVANTKLMNQLSDQDLMNTILKPFGHVVACSEQSQKAWLSNIVEANNALSFSNMALKGNPPYFTLSDTP